MEMLKKWWFLVAGVPFVALAYFAIMSASPENVCDLKRTLDKHDYRFCLLSGGSIRECLK